MANSPLAAEAEFYAAFERADIDDMMEVWADSSAVCCIHPLGDILLGRERIRASWLEIFRGALPRKIDVERLQVIQANEFAIHFVHETFVLPLNFPRAAPIAAVNTYRLIGGAWKIVSHHASPVGYIETTEFESPLSRTRH